MLRKIFKKEIELYKNRIKSSPQDIAKWLDLIQFLIKNELYREAVEHIEKAIGCCGKTSKLFNLLALSWFRLKEYEKTYNVLLEAIEMFPDNIEFMVNLGVTLAALSKFEEANCLFEKLDATFPQKEIILLGKAFLSLISKNIKKALNYFSQALLMAKDRLQIRIVVADILFTSGFFKESIIYYEAALLELESVGNYSLIQKSDILLCLGRAYTKMGNVEKAKIYYKKAIEYSPRLARLHYYLGLLLFSNNEEQEAVTYFVNAAALERDNPVYHYFAGLGYLRLKQYKLAISEFDFAIETGGRRAEYLNSKAIAYYFSGEIQNAEFTFEESIKENPDHSEAYTSLGMLYEKENIKKAVELYMRAYRNGVKDPEILYKLLTLSKEIDLNVDIMELSKTFLEKGEAYLDSGHAVLAIECFEKALNLDKYNKKAALYLIKLHILEEKFNKAEMLVDECLKYYSRDPEYLYLKYCILNSKGENEKAREIGLRLSTVFLILGRENVRAGNYHQAIRAFEEALRFSPENSECHYNLGLMYKEVGETLSSLKHFERFIELSNESKERARVEQYIKELKKMNFQNEPV